MPRDGVLPLAPIYDVVGPIAATAGDLALLFSVLAGEPPVAPPPELPARGGTVESLLAPEMCHPDVAAVLRAAIARLGLDVEPVEIDIADAPQVHHDIQVPEGDRSLEELGVDRITAVGRRARARGLRPEHHRGRAAPRDGPSRRDRR